MSNRAWMPLHIDAYITDTDHLTATEHGAYLLLIMKYWRDGGLPADEGMIRRYAKLTPDQWAESRDVIAAFFDDSWKHSRIEAELAKADEIIEKRRAAGQSKNKKGVGAANAEHVQSNCPNICSDTGAIPLTDNLSATASDEAAACAAPDLDPTILESKMRDAAGEKMQPHGGFVVGPVMELVRLGADIDLDVLPTIRAVSARMSRPARSWDYFVPAIQEAMDRRKAATTWDHRGQAPPGRKPQSEAMQRHERLRQDAKRAIRGDKNADDTSPIIDLTERDYRPH